MCTHMYTSKKQRSQPASIGIREFRENLATYLLESDKPLAITRHGDTVGYYVPARRKRSEADRTALAEASKRLQEMLEAQGISEDEVVQDFQRWRSSRDK
jgi:PHD/YefM family antitoxin component YafN of YafNO toxin-antitoxin module